MGARTPLLRYFSSTRLTIALCLMLAGAGVAGSLLYNGNTAASTRGSSNLFHSPVFLVPGLLLILNVGCCTFTRLRAGLYRGVRAASFLGLHTGLVLLAAGMIVDGRYAFVGTQFYRVGEEPSAAHFDWRDNTDKTFPFTVEVTDFSERFHPMKLQIGVKDSLGGKVGLFAVTEGIAFRVPKTGLMVTPRRFDVRDKVLTFDASLDDRHATGVRAGVAGAAAPGGFLVVPIAWADPEVAEYAARVRFEAPGAPPETHDIRVNHPAAFGGITFCLSDTRKGDDGTRIVGLQMTREPGAPWFWGGALLFGAALLLNLYLRHKKRGTPTPAVLLLLLIWLACPWGSVASAFGRAITADETWEGEVKIVEPVTVEKGATLTIRPGTVVRLSGDVHGASGSPDGGIQVYGKLRVEGEPGKPVRFARLDPSRPWNEIFFKDADAVIRHAVVEGALWGLHIHDGDVSIGRTTLRGNGGGARLKGTGARFDRCAIRDNDIGLRFWEGGPRITASAIVANRVGLFYRDGAGGGKINGCRIANREVDAKIGDWAKGDLDLSGNYWGSGGPKVRDFRNPGSTGKIRINPVLRRSPPVGAD